MFGLEKRLVQRFVPAAVLLGSIILAGAGVWHATGPDSDDPSGASFSFGTIQAIAGATGIMFGLGLFGLSRFQKGSMRPKAGSNGAPAEPQKTTPELEPENPLTVMGGEEDLFRRLFEAAPAALGIFSRNGDFLHANHAWELLTGSNAAQWADFNVLRNPERIAPELSYYLRQTSGDETVLVPPFPYQPAGTSNAQARRWVEAAVFPIKDNGGCSQKLVLRLLDQTELKRAEEKGLDRYNELDQLHRLTNALNRAGTLQQIYAVSLDLILQKVDRASILLFDPDGVMRFKAWRGISCAYRQGVEGHSPWKAEAIDPQPITISDISTADVPPELKHVVLAEGIRGLAFIPIVYHGRLLGKFMLYANEPREFPPDQLRLAQSIASQVGFAIERKRGEEEVAHLLDKMQHQREWMNQIIASIPGVVWEVHGNPADPAQRLDFVSDYVEVMLGHTVHEWISTPNFWLEVMHPEDRERAAQECRALFGTKAQGSFQFRWICRDGRVIWVEAHAAVICDPSGTPIGMRGVTMDITHRKLIEEELRKTQDMLEARVAKRTAKLREAISEMEAFSYSVSHDLRAPLRTMQGYAQALIEDCGDKLGVIGSDYLHRISKAAVRLDKLTQDLLTYSRLSRAEIEVESVDLEVLLTELIQQYPPFQRPAADIRIERPLLTVLAHEPSLAQCLSNLLGNAVKFVAPGVRPRIRIWTEAMNSSVRIWIVDNGIGIPEDFKDRIFGMFERLHVNKDYEGTGIGLALVRKAAERMGGQVGVESSPGDGSHFWLQLPKG
jgi:PAS domain S-box-containing protein